MKTGSSLVLGCSMVPGKITRKSMYLIFGETSMIHICHVIARNSGGDIVDYSPTSYLNTWV